MKKVPIDVWRFHLIPYLNGIDIANFAASSKHLQNLSKDAVLVQLKSETKSIQNFLNKQCVVNHYMMIDSDDYVTETDGFKYIRKNDGWIINYIECGGIHKSYVCQDGWW